MNKKTLIFDAEGFCFGPISTTISLVKKIKERYGDTYFYVLIGTYTSIQLGSKEKVFDEVIECDTNEKQDLEQYRKQIESAEYYIANSIPKVVEHLVDFDVSVVYIDTLFWMWDDLHAPFETVYYYFIQDFVGIDEALKKFKAKINNPVVVPAIIDFEFKDIIGKELDQCLITFGGIDNIFAETPKFHNLFLMKLSSHPQFQNYKFVIAGGGDTIRELEKEYSHLENLEIGTYPKNEFLSMMKHSKKTIANPGLTTFYELCMLDVDCFFLPPINYSQYLQLKEFEKITTENHYYNWSVEEGYPAIAANLPEMKGIALNNKCLEQFLASENKMDDFVNRVYTFLELEPHRVLNDSFNIDCSGVDKIVDTLFSERN